MSITNSEILDAFQFRWACKAFDNQKKISTADFHTILESARLSPSSFGFEPWKFLVIENESLKEKLLPISWGAQSSLKDASHFVIILARKSADTKYDSSYIKHIMKDVQHLPEDVAQGRSAGFEHFQKEDFNLLESDRALFDWASKQTYIALSSMLNTAALLKIDACPIEGFNRQAVEELLSKEGILDSEHFGVSVMAGFGYRAMEPYPKTRQEAKAMIEWIK